MDQRTRGQRHCPYWLIAFGTRPSLWKYRLLVKWWAWAVLPISPWRRHRVSKRQRHWAALNPELWKRRHCHIVSKWTHSLQANSFVNYVRVVHRLVVAWTRNGPRRLKHLNTWSPRDNAEGGGGGLNGKRSKPFRAEVAFDILSKPQKVTATLS